MTSLTSRAVSLAFLIVAPLAALVWVAGAGRPAGWTALGWGVLGLGLVWLASAALAHRIHTLRAYTDSLPDLRRPRPELPLGDDEVGELARALSHLTPRLDEVLNGLSTELGRREAILGAMAEGVLAVDAKLQVSFCNQAFARAAATPDIREGVPLLKVVRDPGLFQLLKRTVDAGETLRQKISIAGREERTFEVYATPLASRGARGALAILHDVTPAERLERVKRDFVANVSHEFRTPLATITGYAETLLNGGLEDEKNRRRFVEIIEATSVRLNNIAADLITLSELEAGWHAAPPGPIAVKDVIHNAIATLEPVARLNSVKLYADDADDLKVVGDRIRLEQALVNLVDNAIKFNRPEGEVSVKATGTSDGKIEISVADSGIGIPRDDLSRIFERFYRVDKARSRQVGGTGLGLSIVRHAVEQMHGNVRVESELGKGACFTITLPRYTG